jgi:hypothetical protein
MRELPGSTDVAQVNASVVVPAWTDHLSHSGDSPDGGDNFNFTPPATPTSNVPQLGGGAAPTAPQGTIAPAGDSFQWANIQPADVTSHDIAAPVGSASLVHLFNDDFGWSPPADITPPLVVGQTSVVDITPHDTVVPPIGSIVPDLHVLAATLPSIGGYIVH